MTKKVLGFIVVSTIILSFSGCASYDTIKLGHIDKNKKTIIVPPVGFSMNEIKMALVKNGWKIKASSNGSVSKGTNGNNVNIHSKTFYNTKYRMTVYETVRMSQFVLKIYVSVIDNETNEEVLSLTGDSLGMGGVFPSSTAEELVKALKEIEK